MSLCVSFLIFNDGKVKNYKIFEVGFKEKRFSVEACLFDKSAFALNEIVTIQRHLISMLVFVEGPKKAVE